MFNLFKKSKPVFEEWEPQTVILGDFLPEMGKVGDVALGEPLNRLQVFGKPISYDQVKKNHYSLNYGG